MSIRRMMLFTLGAKIKNFIDAFKTRVFSTQGEFESEICLEAQLTELDNDNLLDSASLIVTPNGYKENLLYSVVPNNTIGDMSVTRATTATRVNSSGLIENVAVNAPRIDYSNGSCPSILVEPQRTNLVLRSEDFSQTYWTKRGGSFVTPNSTISPDGTNNGFIFSGNGTSGFKELIVLNGTQLISGTTYTYSFYTKANTNNFIQLVVTNNVFTGSLTANFNLSNGTLGTVTSGLIANIISVGNGWYRCTATATATATSTSNIFTLGLISSATAPRAQSTTLNTSVYLWGAQLEAGPNATSYIPTVASTVTRNADVITNTNASTLIGQTEGTIYIDTKILPANVANLQIISLDDNSSNNRLRIITATASRLRFIFQLNGNITQYDFTYSTSYTSLTDLKIAIAYKSGDIAIYINGIQVNTSSNTLTFSASLSRFILGDGTGVLINSINSAILFKTRLDNTTLATLTTL
jgi:hypothetical protein